MSLESQVRRLVASINPDLPVTDLRTMPELLSMQLAQPRFATTLLAAFAALALILTLVGLYGVIAYSVSRRTREIGVRLALGAQRTAVMQMVLRDAAVLLAAGISMGAAASLASASVLKTMLYGAAPRDPLVLSAVCIAVGLAGLIAAYIPAIRAASIDPTQALRSESGASMKRPLLARRFSRRRYDDLSVSIQEHIDERVDELMEEGASREAAERTARREFGNVTLLRERSREVWQWQRLESLLVDLKHIARRLRRSPGFAITVVLTLAIGIGANTAVFSVLNSVLLRPLPYPEPQQLVSLHLNAPGAPGLAEFRDELRLSASMYFTFAKHNQSSNQSACGARGRPASPASLSRNRSTPRRSPGGVLETLNIPAFTGQWLTAADQDIHGLGRVMLSYGYWQRRFGGDPAVVGRTIRVNSQPRVIAGVMPRGFKVVNYDFDLLVPLALDPVKEPLAGFAYRGIARLRPGVAIPQANADVASLLNVWMDSWTNPPVAIHTGI